MTTPATPNQVPQVGDRFITQKSYGWTNFTQYTTVSIARVTATQVVLSDGGKIRWPFDWHTSPNGYKVVSGIGSSGWYYKPTPELLAEQARNRAGIRAYGAAKAFKMPTIPNNLKTDQYETITNLIQEFEERLSAALKG